MNRVEERFADSFAQPGEELGIKLRGFGKRLGVDEGAGGQGATEVKSIEEGSPRALQDSLDVFRGLPGGRQARSQVWRSVSRFSCWVTVAWVLV